MAVSKATPGAQATFTPSMQGGAAAPQFVRGPLYEQGQPGNSYLPPGAACPESAAMTAGKAVTHVAADMSCKGIQGITIVIGDTFNTLNSAISMVNMNLGCAGDQNCIASNVTFNAPVLS